jgi:hypothetical protein
VGPSVRNAVKRPVKRHCPPRGIRPGPTSPRRRPAQCRTRGAEPIGRRGVPDHVPRLRRVDRVTAPSRSAPRSVWCGRTRHTSAAVAWTQPSSSSGTSPTTSTPTAISARRRWPASGPYRLHTACDLGRASPWPPPSAPDLITAGQRTSPNGQHRQRPSLPSPRATVRPGGPEAEEIAMISNRSATPIRRAGSAYASWVRQGVRCDVAWFGPAISDCRTNEAAAVGRGPPGWPPARFLRVGPCQWYLKLIRASPRRLPVIVY